MYRDIDVESVTAFLGRETRVDYTGGGTATEMGEQDAMNMNSRRKRRMSQR